MRRACSTGHLAVGDLVPSAEVAHHMSRWVPSPLVLLAPLYTERAAGPDQAGHCRVLGIESRDGRRLSGRAEGDKRTQARTGAKQQQAADSAQWGRVNRMKRSFLKQPGAACAAGGAEGLEDSKGSSLKAMCAD